MGWGAYFVRLIINSIVAAAILFGVAIFAMNRYMVTVHSSVDRLSSNVNELNATVASVDKDLTASVERLNNNVSRIDREITSLQAKSGRLAAEIGQIQSGTTVESPSPSETPSDSGEIAPETVADDAPADDSEPVVATAPVPENTQTLPIPTLKPQQ